MANSVSGRRTGAEALLIVVAFCHVLLNSCTPPGTPPAAETPASVGAGAGNADVLHVRAKLDSDGTWSFHVTVAHPDTGWDDYADGWDIVLPGDKIVITDPESRFTRLLLHPHVDEQPFTRSQGGIRIPPGITELRVRAHDLVDGFGGQEVTLDLNAVSGPGFEVERP